MIKTYNHENVNYQSAGPKWTFRSADGTYEYSTKVMPGGRPTAEKIARIINGGISRTKGKGIDNLARANMNTTFHNARKSISNQVNH